MTEPQPGERARPGMTTGRLEAFSDGVFAVVITLLVLDLHIPGRTEHASLAHQLGELWPEFLAYLSTFLVVGVIWLNHHAVLRLIDRATHAIQLLNLTLLLTVTLLPFPTSILADYITHGSRADQRVAVLFYGGVNIVMAITFNQLLRYILRRPELHGEDTDPARLALRYKRFNLGLPAYPVVTLLGLLSAPLFVGLILALGVLYLLPTPDFD